MKQKKNVIWLVLIACVVFVGRYFLSKKQKSYDQKVCGTKRIALKGIISGKAGHGNYFQISVDNVNETIYIDIKKAIYFRGFSKYYSYNVGDSIIKSVNSNEITIKNGVNKAIYLLRCDD